MLSSLLNHVDSRVRAILCRVLENEEISWKEGLRLCETRGMDLHAVVLVADEMRRRQAGGVVTYVVNRNINFTNVCIKRCGFCAFSRSHRGEEGYLLPVEEIVRRAAEAAGMGATEVCLQAGLPPGMDGGLYIEITRAVKRAVPEMHIHGFSPEEVLYGAVRSGTPALQYLGALKEAGLGSMPGTSAEILDQEIRDIISPGRISAKQWVQVITAAHSLGIPTTATIMYGHVETPLHWVRHMDLLRSIQHETGGFTEFVPLSLIHQESPMNRRGLVSNLRQGASGSEVVKLHAVARLMLGASVRNIQSSWVKEGPRLAQYLLTAGANDLGGTLIDESISASAGAHHGQMLRPGELRRLARDLGRTPAERNTGYALLKVYSDGHDEIGPLDLVEDAEERFGSYRRLTASEEFRFVQPIERERRPAAG